MLNKKIIALCALFITYQISNASESKEDREYLQLGNLVIPATEQYQLIDMQEEYPELAQGFALLELDFDSFKISQESKIQQKLDKNKFKDRPSCKESAPAFIQDKMVQAAEQIISNQCKIPVQKFLRAIICKNILIEETNIDGQASYIFEFVEPFSYNRLHMDIFSYLPANCIFDPQLLLDIFHYLQSSHSELLQNSLNSYINGYQYDNYIQERFLHKAIITGSPLLVKFLITAGANLNIQNIIGDTPLHQAAYLNAPKKGKISMYLRDNINVQDKLCSAPLDKSTYHNADTVAQILVNAGADLNVQNDKGRTPLHYAALCNEYQVVHILVNASANLNLQDKKGDTPLHTATNWNRPQVARILVNAGADIDIPNNKNQTALTLAITQEMRKILLKAETDSNIS